MPDEQEPITIEPPDPLAGDESSVAKVGERLQDEADERTMRMPTTPDSPVVVAV
ncbi:MAG: hypothetical protein ABW009_13295 [Acidimicrobiales bacterium]